METSEIIKKVRKIEIKTRGLSSNIFAGQYHSAFKGRGMAFSEVREYQFGDYRRTRWRHKGNTGRHHLVGLWKSRKSGDPETGRRSGTRLESDQRHQQGDGALFGLSEGRK